MKSRQKHGMTTKYGGGPVDRDKGGHTTIWHLEGVVQHFFQGNGLQI